MSSLLEAVNASPNKIEITDQLPEHIGDVSIMTLDKLFEALTDTRKKSGSDYSYDPTFGYDISTYYVYGICDAKGITGSRTGSTFDNLQSLGLDWYKQLNKPIAYDQTLIELVIKAGILTQVGEPVGVLRMIRKLM